MSELFRAIGHGDKDFSAEYVRASCRVGCVVVVIGARARRPAARPR